METENKMPQCVGFIMDGNRRYARERGEETLSGHRLGAEVFKEVCRFVQEFNIPHAVFYAFSTENWQRSSEEVAYLLELFLELLGDLSAVEDLRVRIIGRKSDFSAAIQEHIVTLEEKTTHNTGSTIWIALSYGGRAEIIAAVKEVMAAGGEVSEDNFQDYFWSKDMPDPDLIIRTGGEQRLSNFLPWQSVYSELFFTDTYWPAFTKEEFTSILEEYATRQRRHGA